MAMMHLMKVTLWKCLLPTMKATMLGCEYEETGQSWCIGASFMQLKKMVNTAMLPSNAKRDAIKSFNK
ncbi:hypothetical protein AAC387_Pa05g1537 [Persea americana]